MINISRKTIVCGIVLLSLAIVFISYSNNLYSLENDYNQKIKKVCKVNFSHNARFDGEVNGFFVNKDGYLITTYDIINDYNEAFIELSKEYKIKSIVVTKDKLKGFAILKPVNFEFNYSHFNLADSDIVTNGDIIYIYSNSQKMLVEGKINNHPQNLGKYGFPAFTTDLDHRSEYIGCPVLDFNHKVIALYAYLYEQPVIIPINTIKSYLKDNLIIPGINNSMEIDLHKLWSNKENKTKTGCSDTLEYNIIDNTSYSKAKSSLDNLILVPQSQLSTNENFAFGDIKAITFDSKGCFYTLSNTFNNIRKYDGSGKYITTNIDSGKSQLKAPISLFCDIETDKPETIYVLDKANRRIVIFNRDLKYIRELQYSNIYSNPLFSPKLIRVFNENIYIFSEDNKIYVFPKSFMTKPFKEYPIPAHDVWKNYRSEAEKIKNSYKYDDYIINPELNIYGDSGINIGEFNQIQDAIVNEKGIVVLDSGNKRVQVLNSAGNIVDIFKINLDNAKSILYHNNDYYIFDYETKEIELYKDNGSFKGKFDYSKSNSSSGNLNNIALSPLNNIFLTYENQTFINVLDKKGKTIKSFCNFGTKDDDFLNIWSIAITDDGQIITVDDKPSVQIFKEDKLKPGDVKANEYLKTPKNQLFPIEKKNSYELRGVTTIGDNVYVCDVNNKIVHVINSKTKKKSAIKLYGKGISESIKPLQIDSVDRELFIIDPDNCKVIRLDEKGDFLGSFTTIDKYHHICSPVDITVPEKNTIFVLCDKKILCYDENGTLQPITSEADNTGKLIPKEYEIVLASYENSYLGLNRGLAYFNKIFFVSDYQNNMIVMYNLYGNSKTFGKIGNKLGEFYHPTDVIMKTINNKHYIYVADTGNHRVQRFKLDLANNLNKNISAN